MTMAILEAPTMSPDTQALQQAPTKKHGIRFARNEAPLISNSEDILLQPLCLKEPYWGNHGRGPHDLGSQRVLGSVRETFGSPYSWVP